ncbi:alpha/beta fold hydrolase [Solihabitans fulvus]|uniref:alpha/beta fold hydrolase n=1 Tax=Solihabitans fulvus TaxID=1892852 RepID=UPI003F677919
MRQGNAAEFTALLSTAAQFRATVDEPTTPAAPVDLVDGDGRVLVCLPTALATSGPHQYARFAAPLRGDHRVLGLPLPGFLAGEPLPATVDAAASHLAAAVTAAVTDRPFALVGYSSGGLLANAVARRLAEQGRAPDALVLIDSRPLDHAALAEQPEVFEGMAARLDAVDDTRLTAMGGYLRLLDGWQPAETTAPTLLVRAADGRACWPARHDVVDVPGDHFTVLEEHAASTAESVRAWLAGLG